MKKLFLCSILIIAFNYCANAQAKFGLLTGVNFANSSYLGVSEFKTGTVAGFHGGILFEVPMGSLLSLQPEFLFDQRGSYLDSLDKRITIKTNGITVPLLLKANIKITESFKATLHLGPYGGIVFGGQKMTAGSSNQDLLIVNDYYKSDSLKTQVALVDYGVMFGAGVSYNIAGSTTLFLDLRYSLGLSEVQKYRDNPPASPFYEWKKAANRATIVSIGVSFGLD